MIQLRAMTDADFAWLLQEAPAPAPLVAAADGIAPTEILMMLRSVTAGVQAGWQYPVAWMIVADEMVVGMISFTKRRDDRRFEVGYGVAESCRDRGMASAALAALLPLAASHGHRSLTAETSVDNPASQRVLERNGFTRTGTRDDPEDGALVTWTIDLTGYRAVSEVDKMRAELIDAIGIAESADALEAIRVRALGKSGTVTVLLKTLGQMSPEERLEKAPAIQSLRAAVSDAIVERKVALDAAALDARLATEMLDMTLPVGTGAQGSVHPVSQVMDELAEIFADLGFAVATGPEIEDDWHNFTALNIPETHPARAMHDTFYFPDADAEGRKMLLRTHTSPVQIRTMVTNPPPIRIIAPGRTYRSDSDATHTPMFHQVEGLVIDRGVHLGHLKWTLETFVNAFFERDDIVLRLRPSYFPFTEPSMEVDVGYTLVNGRRTIGGAEPDGWLEILGSGMVHPKVIAACGLDPAEWQGFAFGCGIDRLAMLKYGMDDLRAFFDGDLRWLKHYGFRALDVPTLSGGVGA